MKKIFNILLIMLCLIGFTGCSSSKVDQIYNKYKNNEYVSYCEISDLGKGRKSLSIGFHIYGSSQLNGIKDKDNYIRETICGYLLDIANTLNLDTKDNYGFDEIESMKVVEIQNDYMGQLGSGLSSKFTYGQEEFYSFQFDSYINHRIPSDTYEFHMIIGER